MLVYISQFTYTVEWLNWQGGAEGSSIGVIAPFRAQVALLRKLVAGSTDKDVEVNTVDQYQGRDKDIIIFSCTKTDHAPKKSLPAKNKVYTFYIFVAYSDFWNVGLTSELWALKFLSSHRLFL